MKGYIYRQLTLFGENEIIGFGDESFFLKEIPRKVANKLIQKNHYSKKFYAASTIHLGVYFDSTMIGVLQFGFAMNPASMASVVKDTKIDEYLELNRMWFIDNSPRDCKTMALAYSIRYIKRKFPKIAWIQSFADERCNKFGIVYQAANFTYCGEHENIFWEINGGFYHNSLMTRNPNLTPAARFVQENKGTAEKHIFKQFRYIFFIKKNLQKNLLHKILPYPKHYIQAAGGSIAN